MRKAARWALSFLVTTVNGWRTLLTAVQNGAPIKGQGQNYSQNVQYVW